MSQSDTVFPVGYHQFHKDKSINYQLNRWYSTAYWTKSETEDVGRRIDGLSHWKPALLEFAKQLRKQDRLLAAAIAIRAAELFTFPDEPDKELLYQQFQESFDVAVNQDDFSRHDTPFQGSFMPAMRFSPPDSNGTILIHGGLDSFMEEFYTTAVFILEKGYEVILFDGPGQGGALRRGKLFMTHEWEKPVSAVLDFFDLQDITLVGISLGGYLALRAAAFEPRISRAVAFDIFHYDQHGSGLQGAIYRLFIKYPGFYNRVANFAMSRSVSSRHVVSQWVAVTGVETPADWNALLENYSLSDVAHLVKQDVLLMAGEGDYMIPLKELQKNKDGLYNARSITERIFTVEEEAQNHCQVGNIKLALDVIVDWIEQFK